MNPSVFTPFLSEFLSSRALIDIGVPGEVAPDLSRGFPQLLILPAGVQIEPHRLFATANVSLYTEISAGVANHELALYSLMHDLRGQDMLLLLDIGETAIEDNAFLVTDFLVGDNRG